MLRGSRSATAAILVQTRLLLTLTLTRPLIPNYRRLTPRAGGEFDDDEDTAKGMARLFAELAEAFVTLLAAGAFVSGFKGVRVRLRFGVRVAEA